MRFLCRLERQELQTQQQDEGAKSDNTNYDGELKTIPA